MEMEIKSPPVLRGKVASEFCNSCSDVKIEDRLLTFSQAKKIFHKLLKVRYGV